MRVKNIPNWSKRTPCRPHFSLPSMGPKLPIIGVTSHQGPSGWQDPNSPNKRCLVEYWSQLLSPKLPWGHIQGPSEYRIPRSQWVCYLQKPWVVKNCTNTCGNILMVWRLQGIGNNAARSQLQFEMQLIGMPWQWCIIRFQPWNLAGHQSGLWEILAWENMVSCRQHVHDVALCPKISSMCYNVLTPMLYSSGKQTSKNYGNGWNPRIPTKW